MTHRNRDAETLIPRALAILAIGAFSAIADQPALAEVPAACGRQDLGCWQRLYASECTPPASTLQTCLLFLGRLEAVRRTSNTPDVALLLGETLHGLAQKNVPAEVKALYLERSRAAYREVVRMQPLSAHGYLGLAKVAKTGEERVDWLRGAVQAELQPVHMEALAIAAATELGGHVGEIEASGLFEHAYTLEASDSEKWRYGAAAWAAYRDAVRLYPSAVRERSLENVVLRIHDDIDYPLLQRMLREPEAYLAFLANAFATMCEKSIAEIVTLEECLMGLESAVASAEARVSYGDRRLLAEATLTAMRTIAGESPPRSPAVRDKFLDWLGRLVITRPEPVDVAADLLEAQADYTSNLPDRADALLLAIELSPNRGDLRLKLGATYVSLRQWAQALDHLRVAKYLVPPKEQERVDKLFETADERYQARFEPPAVSE
jgi:hypothetical protein